MRELQLIERHEIETLLELNRIRALDRLVFTGGAMLRLCHGSKRYSLNLDFLMKPDKNAHLLVGKMTDALSERFILLGSDEGTDSILFEIQGRKGGPSLKIRIWKDRSDFRWERRIAFSRLTSLQVTVKASTLEQMMSDKTAAFNSRKLIRDCYDVEFLLFRGAALTSDSRVLSNLMKTIEQFKPLDFNGPLGALLEPDARAFCAENRFQFLKEEIVRKIRMDQAVSRSSQGLQVRKDQ